MQLCDGDFLEQIEKVAKAKPEAIILREKDLSSSEYQKLAISVQSICKKYNVVCIFHSFYQEVLQIGGEAIHLPMHVLMNMTGAERMHFRILGASCHSLEDARQAQALGCTYITASHIFATDCKKGLEPRGLDFLQEICEAISIPVYALGGIRPENAWQTIECGARGVCVMSGLMKCENPEQYMKLFSKNQME